MSQAFIAKQGEQVSEGYFTQPAFGLFKDLPGSFPISSVPCKAMVSC